MTPEQRALIKQPHFWLYIVAMVAFSVNAGFHQAGIGLPKLVEALIDTMTVALGALGYGLGATWSPPRRPWNNAERVAHGLQPLDRLPPVPPPLPPPEDTKP